MGARRMGTGRWQRRGSLATLVLLAALLVMMGASRAVADDPAAEATPVPSPSPEGSAASSAAPVPSEVAIETPTPAPSVPAGEPSVAQDPTPVTPDSANTASVAGPSADDAIAGAPAGAAAAPSVSPASTDPTVDDVVPLGSIATDHARSGVVERLISTYVESVVRAAVVDVDGRPSSCFCAVSISVSLDGSTTAVAGLGRVRLPAADTVNGPGGRSGRSGDATAVSVTGGGSATASATSGSTGAVTAIGRSTTSRATGVRSRTTTIDVDAITTSLRGLVTGLGAELERAADADTGAHVGDLLAELGTATAGAPGHLHVAVASWDRNAGAATTATRVVHCLAAEAGPTVPSCGLAVAVTAGSGAQATVLPPRLEMDSLLAGSSVGAPGMATAVSVAISGSAASAARTGDAGTRTQHAASNDPGLVGATGPGSASTASSGRSGDSVAVAVTVHGASATAARSGNTGSAWTAVSTGSGPAPVTSVSGVVPGSGGDATAGATSGDSGSAWALSAGRSGASGESSSGDTGNAAAIARSGAAGHDWTAAEGSGTTAGAVGGTGGAAGATAGSGRTGSSLSLVIAGGSAVATAMSGSTGDTTSTAVGGRGGDTQVTAAGTGTTRSGDAGSASVTGASGDTGDAAAVLVTPLDGSASGRSGRSGLVESFALGGDAGCAANGISPNLACRPATPEVAPPPQPGTAGPAGGAAGAGKPRSSAERPGLAAPTARIHARSDDSADVSCIADQESRTCRSEDTKPVDATSSAVAAVASSGAAVVLPVGLSKDSDQRPPSASGMSLIVLLLNAAVPLLALLSLTAMVMTHRRRRALHAPPHIAKHRRRQELPVPTVPHQRHRRRRNQQLPVSTVPARHI